MQLHVLLHMESWSSMCIPIFFHLTNPKPYDLGLGILSRHLRKSFLAKACATEVPSLNDLRLSTQSVPINLRILSCVCEMMLDVPRSQ